MGTTIRTPNKKWPKIPDVLDYVKEIAMTEAIYDYNVGHIPPDDLRQLDRALRDLESRIKGE